MRIIAGEYKGRNLFFPKNDHVRPTQDKVRAALFNIIMRDINGASVLDLFAGSGAMGIEALSRGAKDVTFVDNNRICVSFIEKNLELIGGENKARVVRADALKAIDELSNSDDRFGIVILDPPYYSDWVKKILIKLDTCDILPNYNIIVAEHFKKDVVPEQCGCVYLIDSKQYGDTVLSIYQKRSA